MSQNSFVQWALTQPDPWKVLTEENFHSEADAYRKGLLRADRVENVDRKATRG